jgi:hypothetical protein
MMTAFVVAALLNQANLAAEKDTAAEKSAAERTAAAAEKTAESAAKSAEAMVRIAERLAPPATPTGQADAPSASAWAGTAGLGLSLLGGNTQTITLTGSVALDKKWNLWTFGVRATGAYGLTNADTSEGSTTLSQTVARRAAATVRADRSFGMAASFVLLGGEFDHVKNIESRAYGEAGASFTVFNDKVEDLEKLYLRLDTALRVGRETRFTYFPTPASVNEYEIFILAPRIAGTLRWALNKNFRISEEFEVLAFMLPPTTGRFLINSNTKLNTRITENVSLTIGFLLNVDTSPPKAGLRAYDFALTAGAEAAF